MVKRVASIILVLCLFIAYMPTRAEAITDPPPPPQLNVGNTDVSSGGAINYWKAAEGSGPKAYEAGTADDYLFSVSLDDSGAGIFTLTLNGVNINTFSTITASDYCGVTCSTSLNIVLARGTESSINIGADDASDIKNYKGIEVLGGLTISGEGSLNVSVNGYGSVNGILCNELLNVSGGVINAVATGGGFGANGLYSGNGIRITGGKMTATASGGDSNGITVFGDDINISGGALTGNGGKNGLVTNGANISIYGGRLIACGGTEKGLDVYAAGALNISGGSVTASSTNDKAIGKAPSAFPAEYKYKSTSSGAIEPGGSYTYGTYTYSENDKYIKIVTTYTVTKAAVQNGDFIVSIDGGETAIASEGDIVSILAIPNSGYEFSSWNVYKTSDTDTSVRVNGNSFTMPGYPVTVAASFGVVRSAGNHRPSRTITVTETSSSLFDDVQGRVKAEANMTNAFSDSVEVKVTDTQLKGSNFGIGVWNKLYPFDISLYIKGTNTKAQPAEGYAVTISIPIPDALLDVKDKLSIAHKVEVGSFTIIPSSLKQINGSWYLVFEAREFSPYAFVVDKEGQYEERGGLPYYLDVQGKEVFIGFAAQGRYIAPSDASVFFKDNRSSFSDTDSHWAKNFIEFVTEREILLGTGRKAFSPNSGMTRAMFATVMGRLYEGSFGKIEARGDHAFTDCDYGDYYGEYVDWASENNILNGNGTGLFHPQDQITREQMAATLYRFASFLGATSGSIGTELSYPDASSISNYAKDGALFCQSSGIIIGRNEGSFVPKGIGTRAEISVIIKRFVELITE